jgi:hypothetical protein
MIQSIITHPGGAHKDEFLACAVLLSQNPVLIVRREPTAAELADPMIAVVDIGGEHTAKRNNFDHHQFPREQTPTCSLSLALQHLGLYEDTRELCPWLEVTEWFDCRGPGDTAQWLEINREVLSKLNSPLDIILLRRFASQTEHKPGEPIWEIMHMIGKDLVDYINGFRIRLDFVKKHAEVWTLQSGNTTFKALFMPRTDPLPEEASAGLGNYVQTLGLEQEVLALIYPDNRGQGYGLRRFNDTLLLDFVKLDNEADVHFTHAQGFIAKTSSNHIDRLKTLVSDAYVG